MRRTPQFILYSTFTMAFMTYLFVSHLSYAVKLTNLALFYSFMWIHLMVKTVSSLAFTPHRLHDEVDVDSLSVDVVVPIYNEDPGFLAAAVRALAAQQRKPRTVWLVDDGSALAGNPFHVLSSPTVELAVGDLRASGIEAQLIRQANAGKRWAQSAAFARSDADIFVTLDSDTVLRPDAIEKLLIPFSRQATMSVGGAAYGQNVRKSILTRVIDIGFTMSFIQGRVAEGFFGSVRVNCGILAAYRAEVVRDNLDRFLNQTFLGAPVKAGDDRCLTLFAKERGRTEFQPEAVGYSALPENLGHLLRQRMRWARSWCWGTLWLLRRPVWSADFLFTFTQALGQLAYLFSLSIAVFGALTGAISPSLLGSTLLTAVGIGMVSHLRYVVAARHEEPLHQRLFTWLLSPLASLLYIVLLMPLYFIAIVRPRPQQTWGTRKVVEVSLSGTTVIKLPSEPVAAKVTS